MIHRRHARIAGQAIFAGPTDSAEALAFIARTSGLDAAHISIYKTLINGLVADGVFSGFEAFYVLGTQDSTNALLDLTANAHNLTAVGAPTFTADRGFDVTNAKTLDTGFTSAILNQNSASIGLWVSTSTAALNGAFAGATNCLANVSSSGNVTCRIFDSLNLSGGATGSGQLVAANRSGASARQIYQNGALAGSDTRASTAVSSEMLISGSVGANCRVAFAFFGNRSFSATEHANIYSRVNTALVALGAA